MPTVFLTAPLADRAGGRRKTEIVASTTRELLRALETELPRLRGWILDDRGRLREHVNVFVNAKRAGLEDPIGPQDEVYVMQAISGGSTSEAEILVGTKKGLFILRGDRGGPMEVAPRQFAGQVVEYAMRDRRTGTYFASVTHGQFGPHLYTADDPVGDWEQAEGPAFPEGTDASVDRIWVIEEGVEDGVLWAGVAPAALFRSEDNGRTWALNRALWDEPSRPDWEGGFGGLCLHSICPWPGDANRLTLGISSVGVWRTEDGGNSWSRESSGLVPRYLPEEARADTIMHCVHKIEQSPTETDTFYMQFHGGVYRSDDAGGTWADIGGVGTREGLPADFGFPIVVDPTDPDRAFVIPLVADVDRVTPEGKLRVYETRDRGRSWRARGNGLPQDHAFETVLRQGFCHDGRDPLGLYFGTESGVVYGSADGGESWTTVGKHLPQIHSVRSSAYG
ncbi:MAG: MoaD/ThiS family protein [Acidobacteriota bacterium]|nr:MoaD/ThiS family protein [Acidobacteriota bacterium]